MSCAILSLIRFVSLQNLVTGGYSHWCPMSNRCGGNQDHWALSNPPPVTSPVSPALPGNLMSPLTLPALCLLSRCCLYQLHVTCTNTSTICRAILQNKAKRRYYRPSPDTYSPHKSLTSWTILSSLLGFRFLPLLGKSTYLVISSSHLLIETGLRSCQSLFGKVGGEDRQGLFICHTG